MALTLGTATVADDGTVTKSGQCGLWYDAFVATMNTALAAVVPPVTIPTGADSVPILRPLAANATMFATLVVNAIQAAEAVIPATAAGDGLQTTPNPNNPATATTRPAVQKKLAII